MNILINSYTCVSLGTNVLAHNLIEAISRVDRKNHYTVLLPKGFGYERLRLADNVTPVYLDRFGSFYYFFRLYLDNHGVRKYLAKSNAQVYLSLGNIGPIRLSAPQVVLYHHPFYIWPDVSHTFGGRSEAVKQGIERHFFNQTLKRTRKFIVQSQYMKDSLKAYSGFGDDRIAVIPSALPFEFHKAKIASDPPSAEPALFYPSRISPHKNHAFLIPVALKLKERGLGHIKIYVTVNQALPEGKKFLRQVAEQNADDIIVNLGELPHDQVSEWYRKSLALFFPSLNETFGIPLVEAMAFKRPILTANRAYAYAVCGDAAEFFDPTNAESAVSAIADILNKPETRDTLVSKGTQRLQQFPTWDSVAQKFIETLESVI